jgi:CIC family chloride channel protein
MAAESLVSNPGQSRSSLARLMSAWLGGNRLGLVVMALVVGAGAGLGAALFREMVFGATWLVTGHNQFGQQGHAASSHLPGLGIWFVLLVPVLGGLVYGPLIYRFAREARGHGVPEVMLAVAENGGRIRPQVTVVKAVASAITIGVGGSVGREGPIVQIGSALASTLGQLVRMSETRLRIIVACGAAGGIAATFNAPLTGLFFGFEIVLREFSLDALVAAGLAAVTGDVISRALFGSAPFFAAIPHGLSVTNDTTYLLVAVLAVAAGLLGVGFKTFLYWLEDFVDELWKGRPEWARPAVGGIALGALLLAVPQMYGVGYPVMNQAVGGHVVVGLLLLFLVCKVLATSLTLSIGGSGGVFAPSLFIGAMAGMAFGTLVHSLFGPEVGPPALYAVIAMGGVFAAAAQAPLTAIASVAEMTGNFGITLPIMLTCGISAAVSKYLSYGSVYTTKLLRRGIDIERPKLDNALQVLTVADVMLPVDGNNGMPGNVMSGEGSREPRAEVSLTELGVVLTDLRNPQELFGDETLEQALRQLTLYGRLGLPVLSEDRQQVRGWLTWHGVLTALSESLQESKREMERGAVAAEHGAEDPGRRAHTASAPLQDYGVVEVTIGPDSPAAGLRVNEVEWPVGALVVAVTQNGEPVVARGDTKIEVGEHVVLLARTGRSEAANGVARPHDQRTSGISGLA